MSSDKVIFSERAHYMCPGMCFGITALLDSGFDEDKIRTSLGKLQAAHPLMRSVVIEKDGRLIYEEKDITIPVIISENNWHDDYINASHKAWDVRKDALLKVFAYREEQSTRILFISHHLLCDGRGLLGLTEEFADLYVSGKDPANAPESLIKGIEDLPEGSDLPFMSRVIIKDANRRWKKEDHKVSYDEYLEFEKKFLSENKISFDIECIDGQAIIDLKSRCREKGISINDYLTADLMVKDNVDKVVIAADIRDILKGYKPGSLGNYSTAFGVKVKKTTNDPYELGVKVSSEIKKIMNDPKKKMLVLACYFLMDPELLDAVAISTLGGFRSDAGNFVGSNMFGFKQRDGRCVTNLGKIDTGSITEAAFIPPASPANKTAWGVLTVNDSMRICKLGS